MSNCNPYETCKKCNNDAVHLAMSSGIVFYGDRDDDCDEESIYCGEDIECPDVSVGVHVCFECGYVEDVWVEHPHENDTINQLKNEIARLQTALNKISGLAFEWNSNNLGGVSIQRRRWLKLAEIANIAQSDTAVPHQNNP